MLEISGTEMKKGEDLLAPLHPEAKALLEDLLRQANNKNPIPARVLQVLDAPMPTGTGRRTVARVFSGAVARAGLPKSFTFHSTRRTAATRMLHAGVDIKTVMAVGGWTDPTTILRHYACATTESKLAAVAKL